MSNQERIIYTPYIAVLYPGGVLLRAGAEIVPVKFGPQPPEVKPRKKAKTRK